LSKRTSWYTAPSPGDFCVVTQAILAIDRETLRIEYFLEGASVNSGIRRSLVALLASGLLATTALTSIDAQADDAGYEGPLQLVYPMNDGSFALGFTPSPAYMSTCSSSGNVRYAFVAPGQVFVNTDGAKNMLATALTAFSLGKNVAITYDSTSSSCYVKRLMILQ
jgi:hypothetical protein